MPSSEHSFELHHTAIVVTDLDRSIAFYTEHFGGVVERIIEDVSDPRIAALHQLPSARFTLAFLQFGPTRLELFRFDEPTDGRRTQTRAHDLGINHICFACPDVAAKYAALRARDVEFTGPPHAITEGDGAGTVLAFCLDPEGNRIELLQSPH
jgi:catechol 2,3-dioxygenase-like lactoylglutathione lyase family enzyme